MKAVTFVEIGKLEMRDVEKPTIQEPTDAILKVTTTAICGSDLHVLEGRIPGMMEGGIIGHEFIGVVEDAGPEVKDFKPGDRALATLEFRDSIRVGRRAKRLSVPVSGGSAGVLVDLRDVPLRLPERRDRRRAALAAWGELVWPAEAR